MNCLKCELLSEELSLRELTFLLSRVYVTQVPIEEWFEATRNLKEAEAALHGIQQLIESHRSEHVAGQQQAKGGASAA